jgi:hypothetical protein
MVKVVQTRNRLQIRSDAARQRWVSDEQKETYWRRHIEDWKKIGLSKRKYCIKNNLSQSSFGTWVREIALRDREQLPSTNAAGPLAEPSKFKVNPFVPLRILSDDLQEHKSEATVEPSVTEKRIEILVPGGAVIRVNDTCNLNFVCQLFSSLKGEVSRNAEY